MNLSSIQDITANQTGTGATAAVTVPANLSSGDLVLVWLAEEAMTGSVTPPTGFSALLTVPEAGSMQCQIYGKVATGSEPATYDFTIGSARTGWAAKAARIAGSEVDLSSFPTSAIVGTPTTANNTGLSVTVAQITGLPAGALLLGHVASRSTGGNISNGSVMTELWADVAFGSRRTSSFHEAPSSGDTGTRTFDVGDSTIHVAGLLALNPPAASSTIAGVNAGEGGNASAERGGNAGFGGGNVAFEKVRGLWQRSTKIIRPRLIVPVGISLQGA